MKTNRDNKAVIYFTLQIIRFLVWEESFAKVSVMEVCAAMGLGNFQNPGVLQRIIVVLRPAALAEGEGAGCLTYFFRHFFLSYLSFCLGDDTI